MRAGKAAHPFAAVAILSFAIGGFGCSTNDTDEERTQIETFEYSVPLDTASPWPKFRRTAMQSGRSPVFPIDNGAEPWVFQTGKGIFSTAVIDGDENIYVGSGDRVFYKLDKNGNELWSVLTGEVIDSSALLDERGLVYVGSGDGFLYAFDRDGNEVWTFEADPPELNEALINWFEGNVAIGTDGTLYVPNDNRCTYAIDRDTATQSWCFRTEDQTWSLVALNPETERLFMGSNYPLFENIFALDSADATQRWSAAARGTVAASPMVASTEPDGLVAVGGFDGFLYGSRQDDGEELWKYGARDHIYASPAQAEDGTIIQPSADGTIYAIAPADGSLVWAYDTREPIRSSPAIDGDGNIYVGSGEGQMFVLNADGSLRWSIQLIDDERDDLNASPALGKERIVISGETGEVFGIPYDYCLRPNLDDQRCTVGPGEPLPDDGVFIVFTTSFGGLEIQSPTTITANQALTFTLFVREDGDTKLAAISSDSVEVTTDSRAELDADVSGDRRYITVVPRAPWLGDAGGSIQVRVQGRYLDSLASREGLRFTFEEGVGGEFDETFNFEISPRTPTEFPFAVASAPGEDTGIVELYRIAAPLPTILPSYNQIGFDSIHYLIGLVERSGDEIIAWGVGGTLDEQGETIVAPSSDVRFPLVFRWDDGLLTMINEEGFTIEFNGFPLPFRFFRVATTLDASGVPAHSPWLNAKTICSEIDFYGPFLDLLGFCNVDTGLLDAVGGAEFRTYGSGVQSAPEGLGEVTIAWDGNSLTASFTGTTLQSEAHNFGLLALDASNGSPVGLNYTFATTQTPDEGTIETVSLDLSDATEVPTALRVYLMVDAYPAAVTTLP